MLNDCPSADIISETREANYRSNVFQLLENPMTDIIAPEQRSLLMGRIRGKNTRPELSVRSSLRNLGLGYRLHAPDLPGRPDIVLRSRRTVIFVHGCFWHRHQGCRYS